MLSSAEPCAPKTVGARRYVRCVTTAQPPDGVEPAGPQTNEPEGPARREQPRNNRWAMREDEVSATLDRIGDLQRQICALQAEQVTEVATFVEQRNTLDAALRVPLSQGRYRSLIAEVSLVTNLSTLTAQSFVSDCYDLATKHPYTLAALSHGTLNLTTARAVARETQLIADPAQQALADQVIAEEVADTPPGKIRALVERRVIEIDPAAAARKATVERADRHVSVTTGTPGTAHLEAYLPAEQAVACWHALDDHARSLRAAGDARSISHLMCDTLVERITGTAKIADAKVHLNLVMTDATLFGADDNPAELTGAGPIPAPVARLIATTGNTWVKRLYTDPLDATLTAADPRRRRFDGALRDFITIRDQHCRGINCASPIRDIDHIVEHTAGGETTAGNGQGVSTNCHTTREHPLMRVTPEPETGAIIWTTPTNRSYRSLPPPALGAGATTADQRRHRNRVLHPPRSHLERRFFRHLVKHKRRR